MDLAEEIDEILEIEHKNPVRFRRMKYIDQYNQFDSNLLAIVMQKLGSIIKRPKMSERLLIKKIPFRYIQDIILAVISTTGFGHGLYSEFELITEKQFRIFFLEKIINLIGICKVCSSLIYHV